LKLHFGCTNFHEEPEFLTDSNDFKIEKSTKISNLNSKIFNFVFEFPKFKNPFIYVRNQEGKYLKKKRDFFTSLIDQKFIQEKSLLDSMNVYFDQDSSIIMNYMTKYKKKFEQEIIYKSKNESNKIAEALRIELIKDVNFELNKLLPKKLYAIILKHDSFKNIINNPKMLSQSYLKFKSDYRKKIKRLSALKKEKVGNFPYFDIKITLQFVFIIVILFFILFPLVLQLLHINYKIYEMEVIKYKYTMLRTSSIKNILFNIGFNKLLVSKLSFIVTFIVILLIPYLIAILNFYWLFSINSIFILLFIFYIALIILIFIRKKNHIYLIAFHFK
jgi:hypothetical protein